MKTCAECGQLVQDTETYCPRCSSDRLIQDKTVRPPVRPGPRAPGQVPVRPPVQPPQGYRSAGGPPRPVQPGQRPGSGPVGVRPMGQTPGPARPVAPRQAPITNQMQNNDTDDFHMDSTENQGISDGFEMVDQEAVVEEKPKKGLFGKKKDKAEKPVKQTKKEKPAKQPKEPKQPKQLKPKKEKKSKNIPIEEFDDTGANKYASNIIGKDEKKGVPAIVVVLLVVVGIAIGLAAGYYLGGITATTL